MLPHHNRAFKEWAVVCEAMKEGRQTVLVRKGGIREEEGIFRIEEREFFLMPTYEHQSPKLVQPGFASEVEASRHRFDPQSVTIDAYAIIDGIFTSEDEDRLNALSDEFIWNPDYVRMRFDFNPYDPLYVVILRVYRLPEAVALPMLPEYGGCKSWVTLERSLSTGGAEPAIADGDFADRRARVVEMLGTCSHIAKCSSS